MAKRLKVVSIGGFGHSVMVFDEMVGMDEAELVGVASVLEDESLDDIINHSIYNDDIERFDDYKQMLSQLAPDVAVVGTRLDMIPKVAIDAANAGCHLICEKPIALDHQSLKRLHKAVKTNNVRLTAMLSMRNLPAFIGAGRVYRDGQIGEVVLANARKSYKWGGARPAWFGNRSTYGGTVGWVGIHAFDMINYITGEEFTSVAAMQSNFAHHSHKDCQDNCAVVLELSNGAHATVSIDLCRPGSAPTHGDDWVRIVGTRGVIEANGSKGFCRIITEQAGTVDITLPEPGKMFRNFLLSLLTKSDYEAVPVEPTVPFMLTHTCLCARDAAEKGTVVRIRRDLWQ